jgi:hypothetical protein
MIITDLDGTIADHEHRVHLAQARAWEEYHFFAHKDPVHEGVVSLLNLFWHHDYEIVIITGRPEKWRGETEKWLARNNVSFDKLHMRSNLCFEPDEVMKEQIYQENYLGRDVLFALDDQHHIVRMWSNRGIDCWQVRKGMDARALMDAAAEAADGEEI